MRKARFKETMTYDIFRMTYDIFRKKRDPYVPGWQVLSSGNSSGSRFPRESEYKVL